MDPIAIYQDLKEKIIWLEIEPGHTLNLTELAQDYGVSRTPVMIALTRLNAEEWVVRNGVHFVVSPLTIDRMREFTEIRAVLEIQANIWAMNRITEQGMSELRALKEQIRDLGPDATNREIIKLDFKFHHLLYRQSQNQQLATMLERLLSHYLRFWLSGPRQIEKECFFSEAVEIIKAIETKDEITLRAASSAHIKVSLDTIMGIKPDFP
ncbi:MAG: GntR family transcriptional regulator [Deltaproteobacteria bacterium]|nr:GntR family transcriptional regulator [Deltaproteobacteria bacterium]MBW2083684.1 GntR family transcriptional regulator [Deltaproteobacteria bacterium]HDM10454.1 GntR family transcriptional regulator [Desulfobacteraceae bacterium]